MEGVLMYMSLIAAFLGSAGCIFLHSLSISQSKIKHRQMQTSHYAQTAPSYMTQIGTKHVLNTNLRAELPVICLYHFLRPYFIFFLLFVWLISPLLQDLFPMVSSIPYMDFFFEHSPASFSLLFYCHLETS